MRVSYNSICSIPNNRIIIFRFGTSVKKVPKKDDWPLPGVVDPTATDKQSGYRFAQTDAQINLPSYTRGSKKSHNRKKTLFTTQEIELDPVKLKAIRDKIYQKGDALGPG